MPSKKVWNPSKYEVPEHYIMTHGQILVLLTVFHHYCSQYFDTEIVAEKLQACLDCVINKDEELSQEIRLQGYEEIQQYFNAFHYEAYSAISGILHCYYYNPDPQKATFIWLYNRRDFCGERNGLGIDKKKCL